MDHEGLQHAAGKLADELAAMTLDEVRAFSAALAAALADYPATHQALVEGLGES